MSRAVPLSAVLEQAYEVGFDLVGTAPLRRPRGAEHFEAWLAAGHHADMGWLERDRPRIVAPERNLEGGQSLVMVGLGHARGAVATPEGARLARYAAGRDYHNLMRKKLRRLARRLRRLGLAWEWRAVVDAGPLMERSHAAEAGLGFESKAANLLHPVHGPWFFLGALLVDAELEPTPTPPAGSCGSCTACLEACPTGAILEPGRVDAGRCISYQTIENRGAIPHELREATAEWAFGCDVCSEVCPWGREAPDRAQALGTHPRVEAGPLDWLRERGAGWSEAFEGSPLQRAERVGLARNAALVLGRHACEEGREALLAVLEKDPSPVVREAAFWALGRGHAGDRGIAAALQRAAFREPDPGARAAMAQDRETLA
jgi:epoxyqueuosine reductase